MSGEKFLIDANSLITPYRNYYPFDLVPSFWEYLQGCFSEGNVAILDLAKDEVIKGNDDLSNWLKSCPVMNVCNHKKEDVLQYYSQVLIHLQTSGYYKETALNDWAREKIADPWLIAAAKAYGYIIVTLETSNPNLSIRNPVKRAKIPDVAAHMGVECRDLLYFMRAMGFCI